MDIEAEESFEKKWWEKLMMGAKLWLDRSWLLSTAQ